MSNVILRLHNEDSSVKDSVSLAEDSSIFAEITKWKLLIASARDGLGTIYSRQKRSFKTLGTKHRVGVFEFLSDAKRYINLRRAMNTAEISPKRRYVSFTALFQKPTDVRDLNTLSKLKSCKLTVYEALLVVEVEDDGDLGLLKRGPLNNAQFIYMKAVPGHMSSSVNERVMSVQSVLYNYANKKVFSRVRTNQNSTPYQSLIMKRRVLVSQATEGCIATFCDAQKAPR